jgi:hypothetical protein
MQLGHEFPQTVYLCGEQHFEELTYLETQLFKKFRIKMLGAPPYH